MGFFEGCRGDRNPNDAYCKQKTIPQNNDPFRSSERRRCTTRGMGQPKLTIRERPSHSLSLGDDLGYVLEYPESPADVPRVAPQARHDIRHGLGRVVRRAVVRRPRRSRPRRHRRQHYRREEEGESEGGGGEATRKGGGGRTARPWRRMVANAVGAVAVEVGRVDGRSGDGGRGGATTTPGGVAVAPAMGRQASRDDGTVIIATTAGKGKRRDREGGRDDGQ